MNALSPLVLTLLQVAEVVLEFYKWMVIMSAVMSWLIAFDAVNPRNRFVHAIGDFLYRITEPALRPIRRIVPLINGLDLSPIILIFIIYGLQKLLFNYSVFG